jgi:poly-gamma-glutamate synthesis protein (capsule biosynthesis protein)
LYNERGWLVFAGGANQDEAIQARTIEHNGNRLAFIGCNSFGPGGAWATDSQPGAARCDYDAITASMQALRAEGVLPIFTFQHTESYVYNPLPAQERDFRSMIDAGAIIVSGSQAHFPQIMEFYNDGFIHYGLGNLFFDQMDVPVVGTRREFIDRHIFYDGRHISTELLTAMLEDYARPRPMTTDERRNFLSDIFAAAGW